MGGTKRRMILVVRSLNSLLLNKTFPEAIAQSVLGEFRGIAEARQALDHRKEMALLCKHCWQGNVEGVAGTSLGGKAISPCSLSLS